MKPTCSEFPDSLLLITDGILSSWILRHTLNKTAIMIAIAIATFPAIAIVTTTAAAAATATAVPVALALEG